MSPQSYDNTSETENSKRRVFQQLFRVLPFTRVIITLRKRGKRFLFLEWKLENKIFLFLLETKHTEVKNRKRFTYFHKVMVTTSGSLGNEKSCGKTSRR